MKRPIKFRGKRSDNGELVYGSYCHEVYRDLGTLHAIIDEGGEEFIVDPDSITQLVGFDANGKEIYEGDTVIRYDSEEEFNECPENGVLREVILYTAVSPDLNSYYCELKEDTK